MKALRKKLKVFWRTLVLKKSKKILINYLYVIILMKYLED